MNDNEAAATAFLVAAFIDGEPATPTEIATALSVLARNRPWLAFGKLIFAAMVAANLERETK